MALQVKCPKGHRLKIPERLNGKTIDCPTCGTAFRVGSSRQPADARADKSEDPTGRKSGSATAQPQTDEAPAAGGLVISRHQLTIVAAGWVASLLVAILTGAFVSRSMGPPIVVNTVASAKDTAAASPAPNFTPRAPKTVPSVTDNSGPDGTHSTAVAPAAFAPLEVIPEGGSGVATMESHPRTRSNQIPKWSNPLVPMPHGTPPSISAGVESTVKADLQEAVTMLRNQQFDLLVHDFLSPQIQVEMSSRPRSRSRSTSGHDMFSEDEASELMVNLQAAVSGEMKFNRTNTLVEIRFVRAPTVTSPATPPSYIPAMSDRPQRRVPGLGSNLPKMLTAAAKLLKRDQIQEFIENVYPVVELTHLAEADFMAQLIHRIRSNPEMQQAMIRDLELAAKASPGIKGTNASVSLPALVPGDPERELRFQLVNRQWRFFDGNAATRSEYRKLVQGKIPPVTIPGVRGSLLLTRHGENWRLSAPPVVEPL